MNIGSPGAHKVSLVQELFFDDIWHSANYKAVAFGRGIKAAEVRQKKLQTTFGFDVFLNGQGHPRIFHVSLLS